MKHIPFWTWVSMGLIFSYCWWQEIHWNAATTLIKSFTPLQLRICKENIKMSSWICDLSIYRVESYHYWCHCNTMASDKLYKSTINYDFAIQQSRVWLYLFRLNEWRIKKDDIYIYIHIHTYWARLIWLLICIYLCVISAKLIWHHLQWLYWFLTELDSFHFVPTSVRLTPHNWFCAATF